MHQDTQRSERFKNERKRLGWSQQKAADAIGVRREMWAKYEAGAEPGADALSAMQRAGFDVDYVLTGTTEAESLAQRDALHEAGGIPKARRDGNNAEAVLLSAYRASKPDDRQALLHMAAFFRQRNQR